MRHTSSTGVLERGAGVSRAGSPAGRKGFMGTWEIRQFSGRESRTQGIPAEQMPGTVVAVVLPK